MKRGLFCICGALAACTITLGEDLDVSLDTLLDVADVPPVDVEADSPVDIAEAGVGDADAVPVGRALNPRFELESEDFFATPWPSDARTLADGSADLGTFPGADEGLMLTFREAIEGDIFGFSTMPVVYVAFDGPVGALSLPSAATTLRSGSVAQLIDVSEDGCGTRIPIVLGLDTEGDPYRDANTLSASPVPGFVLRQSTPYAFVLRREFGLDVGREVVPPPAFRDALDGAGEYAASLEPLVRCLEQDDLDLEALGVATVFTTQDATSELQLFRDHVVSNSVDSPVVTELAIDPELTREDLADTWRGSYLTPIFQEGESPYPTGGGFGYDDEGNPAVQRWEEVPFAIAIPNVGEGPFPVIVQMPGTGGDLEGTISGRPGIDAITDGFAVATFAPQFHDTRAVPGSDPVVHGFNYLNPTSGRTVFRQQVLDTSYFVRVLREQIAESEFADSLDLTTLLYGGHSQGGLVGGLLAGVESEFEAYVLNGTGAYISVTVIERTDPFDIQALIDEVFLVGRRLDVQHPLVALVQLGTDVVEPHAFAQRWRGTEGDPAGSHMYIVNGFLDHTTFPPSIDALTVSAGLAPLAPAGWDPDPFDVWDLPSEVDPPISGNVSALDGRPLTMVTYLDADEGHFTLRRNDEARALALRFWREALTGTPVATLGE